MAFITPIHKNESSTDTYWKLHNLFLNYEYVTRVDPGRCCVRRGNQVDTIYSNYTLVIIHLHCVDHNILLSISKLLTLGVNGDPDGHRRLGPNSE